MKEVRDRYEIFMKVCETGSFSRAAEALNYTQSGISQMMAGLEEELGVQLFARIKKGVILTENGKRLFPYIQEMVNQKDKLRQAAFDMNSKGEGKFRIGSFTSVTAMWLPDVIHFFRENYPKVEVQIFDGNYDEIRDWIVHGQVDCGFLSSIVADDLKFHPILKDPLCAVMQKGPKPHGKSYNKWLGDQAKPSHRELLRVAIDKALAQKPADLDELLKLLRESGCEVSGRGKSYRLKLPGWSKVARLDSLGDGYTLEDLLAVLAGQKEHTPRQKPVKQADPSKVNLLVDIQAKLQAGKGAGYVRWAKVFNLKQMAQTVNYLTEHNLLEYAMLEEKAAAATAHHNELSAKIKAAEKRMAEIAVLRTHIINYAKTRETYVAYRKAGYSKKFREEHEEEILLHQAAKNAFDDMGVKKLPKVKELQAEYARLLEEKKKTYAEYRRSREEMRELLAAKANVDRLMSMEEEKQSEKEHER